MRTILSGFTGVLFGLVTMAGCASTDDGGGASGSSDLSGGGDDGSAAFHNVSRSLQVEATDIDSAATQAIQLDSRTTASTIMGIVPPKNTTTVSDHGATPKSLEGVYWMRGNPLADYLLSFANTHWTTGNGTPYGYLAISSPGSFAFKHKVVAQGAQAGDFKFLPSICRVPDNDEAMRKIAEFSPTHDSSTFSRPIADDFAAMAASPTAPDPRADDFMTQVQIGGQLPLEGTDLLGLARDGHAFYESRWNSSFTESSVQVVFVATAPGILRTLFPPVRVPDPKVFASFSLAPHPTDRDVFVRKSFIAGTSMPNYYFLTRIVDGQGRALPHMKEFLQCVSERSGGEVLKVVPQPAGGGASAPPAGGDFPSSGGGGG